MMDISFSSLSVKHNQAVSTIIVPPSAPPSSFSFHFSPTLPCLGTRTEFLGRRCLRLSPHRSGPRKSKKFVGFRCIYSPRFVFTASLDYSQPDLVVIVVAVVSFSAALTVPYVNNSKKTKMEQSPAKEEENSVKELSELVHDSESLMDQVRLKEAKLLHGETPMTSSLGCHDSGVSDPDFVREPEVTGLSSPPLLFSGLGALEGYQQGAGLGSEFPTPSAPTAWGAAPALASDLPVGLSELGKLDYVLGEDGEISSFSFINGESARKELHTFYEVNKYAMESVENSTRVKVLCFDAANGDNNNFSSLKGGYGIQGAKLSAQDFDHAAENIIRLQCHKEGSLQRRRNMGERRGNLRYWGKGIFLQNGGNNLFPSLKEKHTKNSGYSSRQPNAYTHLLRDGRLVDCVELLEDMKGKGLLDMNNVHHASFFHSCKVQNAVKEALRFTKLIPNPSLSTFNMLMSVCASSQDAEGAFQVLQLVQEAGLKPDCKLYTTLISTCAKSGKVDAMFKVFHEMVNAGVEPNVHTYGALIDGCAKAGQVAKAFGAYGIMRSKNVKPDRVVFNALITACGQSGAVDRAFDVLAEMRAETQPIDPDHVTIGALMRACANAGEVSRAREVYNMIHEYKIKGTPMLYTIAVNSCSQTGDWEFACSVRNDMIKKGVLPDEMLVSAYIDIAGHSGKLEAAFEILQEARNQGIHVGIISYSSLMGACSNAKNWQKALELYGDIKNMNLKPTVSTMNALITSLCDADQLQKAVEILSEMQRVGLCPNTITYSILLVACEKMDDLDVGTMLLSQAKKDGVAPNLVMCRSLIAMCLRRFKKACTLGEPVVYFNSRRLQMDNKWTSLALTVYRETIKAGVAPTMEELSQILGCLKLPHDASLKERLVENLEITANTSKSRNLCSLVDGFGQYDPRAFSLLEEAASLGIIRYISFKDSPIVVDTRNLQIYAAEVYFLTVLKGLKHRLAAGVKLPNITILLPIDKTHIQSPTGQKTISLSGRISQAITALLRRLGIPYQGNESYGKIRINGIVVKKWLQPKISLPYSGKPTVLGSLSRLGKGITHQQRSIRTGNLS